MHPLKSKNALILASSPKADSRLYIFAYYAKNFKSFARQIPCIFSISKLAGEWSILSNFDTNLTTMLSISRHAQSLAKAARACLMEQLLRAKHH